MLKMKRSLLLSVLVIISLFVLGGLSYSATIGGSVINMVTQITTHPHQYTASDNLQMKTPLIADLDCDGVLEVISVGYNSSAKTANIYAWKSIGSKMDGWPISVSASIISNLAVGDIDGDGELEVVLGVQNAARTSSYIYAWNPDGTVAGGYPMTVGFVPENIAIGDIENDFAEEVVCESSSEVSLADIDADGKQESIFVSGTELSIIDGDVTELVNLPLGLISVSNVVSGDIDGDGNTEIFFAGNDGSSSLIFGYEYSSGSLSELSGFPIDANPINNTSEDFLTLADINDDGTPEILSGSSNGYLSAYTTNGVTLFDAHPATSIIHQPVVGDINKDGNVEIVASSSDHRLYCYNGAGAVVTIAGWPGAYSCDISNGLVLADIDEGVTSDDINPENDLELVFGASNGKVYVVEMAGDFIAEDMLWCMYGFSNRCTNSWTNDNNISGWTVSDSAPSFASIACVYDWNRGARVIELDGAGMSNCYAYMNADGTYLDTTNTQMQWSMKYSYDFAIYVSVDTINGRRFLYYTPADVDQLASCDPSGNYIHHGLGAVVDGKWHTFSRSLVSDLKEAEPSNEIVDVNAFYIQGSGRIDDLRFLSGIAVSELTNYAETATVSVSSGDSTKDNVNDGNPDTVWVSDTEVNPWLQYSWADAIVSINKISLENVIGATGGKLYVVHADGTIEEISFSLTGSSLDVVFDTLHNVKSVTVKFDTGGGSVSAGEVGVYYDPSYERDVIPSDIYLVGDYIKLQNGFFWNPELNSGVGGYWIPHGIAYQTWDFGVGLWQSLSELRLDLQGIADAGANAVNVNILWKNVELTEGSYTWGNYDALLEEAQANGLKVFANVGGLQPPSWFADGGYTLSPPVTAFPDPWKSNIISIENTDAQAKLKEFLRAVVTRYSVGGDREDLSGVVAGWIIGSETGYFNLSQSSYVGYDDESKVAFRTWLSDKYGGDIDALNAKWADDTSVDPLYLPNYPYTSFSEVDMPIPYGYKDSTAGIYLARDKASWYDLTEWREESTANFIALLAKTVRDADPSHLITYASLGTPYSENDAHANTEDPAKIVQACSDIGAPLSFWSINNYPFGVENDEFVSVRWGIEKAKHDTGLSIMVAQTGASSTAVNVDESKQAVLDRNAIWESLEAGAIGVCVFHWNDRDAMDLAEGDMGFGLVSTGKEPKAAYSAVKEAFEKVDEIGLKDLLPLIIDLAKDIAFVREDAVDTISSRYEIESNGLFGALERMGFNPTFINKDELIAGDYSGYKAIVFSRNQKISSDILSMLPSIVLSGVKVHANADLPGIMDEYGINRSGDSAWQTIIQDVFGINVSASVINVDPNIEDSDYLTYGYFESSSASINYQSKKLYSSVLGFNSFVDMWKYQDNIAVGTGTAVAKFDSASGAPAIIVNKYAGSSVGYDAAISLFSLGASNPSGWTWEDRYNWTNLIYRDATYGFGLVPDVQVTGSAYVLADIRAASDGTKILISLKNYNAEAAQTVLVSYSSLVGAVISDLINGTELENPSDGTIQYTVDADGHALLLATAVVSGGGDTGGGTGETGGTTGGTTGGDTGGTTGGDTGGTTGGDAGSTTGGTDAGSETGSGDSDSDTETTGGTTGDSSTSASDLTTSGSDASTASTTETASTASSDGLTSSSDSTEATGSTGSVGYYPYVFAAGGVTNSADTLGAADANSSEDANGAGITKEQTTPDTGNDSAVDSDSSSSGSGNGSSDHARSYGRDRSGVSDAGSSGQPGLASGETQGMTPQEAYASSASEATPLEQFRQAMSSGESDMPNVSQAEPKMITRSEMQEALKPSKTVQPTQVALPVQIAQSLKTTQPQETQKGESFLRSFVDKIFSMINNVVKAFNFKSILASVEKTSTKAMG